MPSGGGTLAFLPKRAFSRGVFSLGAVRWGLSPFIRQMSAV